MSKRGYISIDNKELSDIYANDKYVDMNGDVIILYYKLKALSNNGEIYASDAYLMGYFNCTKKTIQRRLKCLEDCGLIERYYEGNNRKMKVNTPIGDRHVTNG